MDFRLFFASSLALLVACADDTPSGDGDTGSGTAGTADGGPSTANGGPSTADDGGSTQGQDGSGSTGPSATGSSDDGGASSESTAAATGDGGSTDGGSSSGGGSTDGGSSDDAGTTSACEPITDDASAINQPCQADGDCPDEYTCQPFSGIVLQQTCQIICEESCECPEGLSCVLVQDKTMVPWNQCAP